jgi:hypothetical protein
VFIAHYKAVDKSLEFYSEKRSSLDFPVQVELNGIRYLLNQTIQVSTPKQEKNFIQLAQKMGIKFNIKIFNS